MLALPVMLVLYVMCIPVKILTFKKTKKKVFQLGPSQLLNEHSKFGATPHFAVFAAWHFAVLQEPGAFSRLVTGLGRKLPLANVFSLKCVCDCISFRQIS